MKTIETNDSMQPDANYPGLQPTEPAPVENPALAARDADERAIAQKIERSVAYMMRHLDQPLQVATLAAQAKVSPSHYFALFKRRTGHAPIDFFIHLRMHRACELLDSTWLRVKEVAAALGYDDPFYFSRIFKSVNRIAPSEYRGLTQESRDAIKKTTLSFGAAASETHPALQITSPDLVPFTGATEPRQKSALPMPPASEAAPDRDWKGIILREKRSIVHSKPQALCYDYQATS